MKNLVRLEELFLGMLAFYWFLSLPVHWWWFFILLLAPDLSMIAYVFGPRMGSVVYNLVHHRAISAGFVILGGVLHSPGLQAAGLILFAHSSFDRALGYGLKHADSFQHTHLGVIGRQPES